MSTNSQTKEAERYRGFLAIPVPVAIRAGRLTVRVREVRDLAPGDVLPLDRAVGSPFELVAGPKVLAEVLPLADEQRICVKIIGFAGGSDGD